MFEIEFRRDTPDGLYRKGDRFMAYGYHWALAFDRTAAGKASVEPYVDRDMFLVWDPFRGWFHVEACFVKPLGAPEPNVGPCGQAELK